MFIVYCPTHNKNYILDLVLISFVLSRIVFFRTIRYEQFPIFTKLFVIRSPQPHPTLHPFSGPPTILEQLSPSPRQLLLANIMPYCWSADSLADSEGCLMDPLLLCKDQLLSTVSLSTMSVADQYLWLKAYTIDRIVWSERKDISCGSSPNILSNNH